MPWYTNKKTGKHFNTDWIDSDADQKEKQIKKAQDQIHQLREDEEDWMFIDAWYDKHTKDWVIQKKDIEGNQVGEAERVGTKADKDFVVNELEQELEKRNSVLKHILHKQEMSIKDSGKEIGICIDNKGNELFRQEGFRDYIDFTEDQLDKLPGSILTHNHPKGTCFSKEDLYIFANYNLRELRIVCGDAQWYNVSGLQNIVMSIYRTGKPGTRHYSVIERDYAEAVNKYIYSIESSIYSRTDIDEVEAIRKIELDTNNFRRKWLKENAKNYGFEYKEYKL